MTSKDERKRAWKNARDSPPPERGLLVLGGTRIQDGGGRRSGSLGEKVWRKIHKTPAWRGNPSRKARVPRMERDKTPSS